METQINQTSIKYSPLIGFSIVLIPILLLIGYMNYYVPRQECAALIKYQPATESMLSNDKFVPSKQGEDEYYYRSKSTDKFKTRAEAMQNCILSVSKGS